MPVIEFNFYFFFRAVKAVELVNKQVEDGMKNVNLLRVYTIYKQKFRRLTKNEYDELLGLGKNGKTVAFKLCKEFMKAKSVPDDDVCFARNIGFLSFPRFLPLVALLAERSEYMITPSLVKKLDFTKVPQRFREKFSQLLVYGFWFLGRVINDSLSEKEQVNRGNMFNFVKGDMGYWWAGVKILDWNHSVNKEKRPDTFSNFLKLDPPKYRFYSSRAIHNMGQHPLYFLSDADWENYNQTVRLIKHKKVRGLCSFSFSSSESYEDYSTEGTSPPGLGDIIFECDDVISDFSTCSLGSLSNNSFHHSRESVD